MKTWIGGLGAMLCVFLPTEATLRAVGTWAGLFAVGISLLAYSGAFKRKNFNQ